MDTGTFSWDNIWDGITGTFREWLDYERWDREFDLQRDYYAAQQAQATAEQQRAASTGALMPLLLIGAAALGAYLLLKR